MSPGRLCSPARRRQAARGEAANPSARRWRSPAGWLLAALLWLGTAAGQALAAGTESEAESGAGGAASFSTVLAGRSTRVDVYTPAEPRAAPGTVILVHGFARTRHSMAGHARALAAAGYYAVVPDMPYVLDSRDNALALRELMAQMADGGGPPALGRFLLVGFSAGGLAALLAADAPGVAGYVGLDPYDRPSGIGLEAARRLQAPVWVLRGPAYACNAFGAAAPWLDAFPNLAEDRLLAQAGHCDFESPTDLVCRLVCGGTRPELRGQVSASLLEAARAILGPARQG